VPPIVQAIAYHQEPLRMLRRARARYGPVFTLRFPLKDPLVFVVAAEALDTLLDADPIWAQAGAARRSILPQASPASPFGGDAAAHQLSRARMWPGFAPERMARIEPRISALTTAHVARWPIGRPFRVLEAFRTLCTDITVRFVLGVEDSDTAVELVRAIRRMLNTPGNPPLPLPGGDEGPGGAVGRIADSVFARRARPVRALLLKELRVRRITPGQEGDVVQTMLNSQPPLKDEDIVDQLLIVLMAAQEPPAIALTNVIYELAGRPPLNELFVDEPMARRALIAEVLRLRPSASAVLRQLTEPMEVEGHRLPADTTIACPSPLLHRDPIAFPDPDDFLADRFADGAPPGAPYVPFGGGIRRCLGEYLAEAEFRAVLPVVLEQLRFRRAWPQEERMVVRATVLVPHRSALMSAQIVL
jgi:cytochrome P450